MVPSVLGKQLACMLRRSNSGISVPYSGHELNGNRRSFETTTECGVFSRSNVLRTTIVAGTIALGGFFSAVDAKSLQAGAASWYGPGFQGRKTANGERFNTHALTAAHRSLPFGSRVKVTNNQTGRSVVVRINDRGPFVHGRIIDLSKASAQAIGISGVGRVTLSRL
jgi:rare lipoprotein A